MMRRIEKRIRLVETKSNALRLIVISKHLFPQKAIKDRKMKLDGNNVLVVIQCRKGVLKPLRILANLGEIRFARMLILLPIKL